MKNEMLVAMVRREKFVCVRACVQVCSVKIMYKAGKACWKGAGKQISNIIIVEHKTPNDNQQAASVWKPKSVQVRILVLATGFG